MFAPQAPRNRPTPPGCRAPTTYFTFDTARTLSTSIVVSYWNGHAFVPVTDQHITWATASNQPTAITFDPIRSGRIRLDLTSRTPGTANGFLQITELQASGP